MTLHRRRSQPRSTPQSGSSRSRDGPDESFTRRRGRKTNRQGAKTPRKKRRATKKAFSTHRGDYLPGALAPWRFPSCCLTLIEELLQLGNAAAGEGPAHALRRVERRRRKLHNVGRELEAGNGLDVVSALVVDDDGAVRAVVAGVRGLGHEKKLVERIDRDHRAAERLVGVVRTGELYSRDPGLVRHVVELD